MGLKIVQIVRHKSVKTPMFSTKRQLIKRTGKNGVGRYDFLKLLATEYKTTKSKDAKEQTLGNLANFAYDPINYGYMRQLQIIDLFLYALSESNPRLVRFAIGGICNLSLDPINRIYILRNQGVELVSSLLSSQDDQILLSAVSSLMFLTTPESRSKTTTPEIIKEMTKLTSSDNTRVKNLAIIFLDDCEATKLESTKETYGN